MEEKQIGLDESPVCEKYMTKPIKYKLHHDKKF